MKLPDRFLWHPGRCLPYGDGVAYWALGRDGAPPVGHSRGRPRGGGENKARGRPRALDRRRRRARVHFRAPGRPARSRGVGPRTRRAVRRMAAVLRAARRARPGRDGVRGHALGRGRPARLRRVPARLVGPAPDLHPDLCQAGAVRAAAGMARGPPQRHRDPARAARRRSDGGPARVGGDAADGGQAEDHLPRRGHPAVRDRDGPSAQGPWPPGRARRRAGARRGARRARRAGQPDLAARRAARRSRLRRARAGQVDVGVRRKLPACRRAGPVRVARATAPTRCSPASCASRC